MTALVSLWVVVTAGAAWASGCYGRNCEGETTVFGQKPGEGRLVTPDRWESTPINGKWLPFPQQRVWIFDTRELGARVPYEINVTVSADEIANDSNFVAAGGNLAEVSGVGEGRFVVKNGTCADYFIRVVAHASPNPPANLGPTSPEAGTDAGADAALDATADASDAEAGP